MSDRDKQIVSYNAAGIALNLFLSLIKYIVGTAIHSTAIVIDAINGLADMLSYGVSILTTFFSNKKSDRSHPMGYGRIEYLSTFLITVMITYLGLRSIISSLDDIFFSEGAPDYNLSAILVMVISLIGKYTFGSMAIRKGRQINSNALLMAGTDTRQDSFVSIGILSAILIYRLTGFKVESYFSIFISLTTLKVAGVMLKQTMDQLIGERSDPEYVREIKKQIIEEKGVENVFNLVIHDYGENNPIGSVNIEVDKDMSAKDITILSNRIIRKAKDKGLTLTSIGISGTDLNDPKIAKMWDKILKLLAAHKGILRGYGFAVDNEDNVMSFYVLLDPDADDNCIDELKADISKIYPKMRIEIETCSAE